MPRPTFLLIWEGGAPHPLRKRKTLETLSHSLITRVKSRSHRSDLAVQTEYLLYDKVRHDLPKVRRKEKPHSALKRMRKYFTVKPRPDARAYATLL